MTVTQIGAVGIGDFEIGLFHTVGGPEVIDKGVGFDFQFVGEVLGELINGNAELVCRRPSGSLLAVPGFLPRFGGFDGTDQKFVISVLQKIFVNGIAFDTAQDTFFEISGKFNADIFESGLFFIPRNDKGEIKFAFAGSGTELLTDDVTAEGFIFGVAEKTFAFDHPVQRR